MTYLHQTFSIHTTDTQTDVKRAPSILRTPSYQEGQQPEEVLIHQLHAMARPSQVPARCVGSTSFQPEAIVADQDTLTKTQALLANDDLFEASRLLFGLPENDAYTYHATAAVKLAQVQRIVSLGAVNGLHTWYRAEDLSPVCSLTPMELIAPSRSPAKIH